jgi:hypothetical protein
MALMFMFETKYMTHLYCWCTKSAYVSDEARAEILLTMGSVEHPILVVRVALNRDFKLMAIGGWITRGERLMLAR